MTHERVVESWLSTRDDRARVLAMLLLAGGFGALTSLRGAGAALALAILLAVSARLGPVRLLRRLWPLLALVVPLFLLTPFWHRPATSTLLVAQWTWGPTDAGLETASRIAARVLAMGLIAVSALDAAPFERTIKALQDLRVPRPLTHLALLTYRYLFVFREDLGRIQAALSARGFEAGPNLATARTFGGVTGGLLVRSLARTERVEQAMRCRGYSGELVTERSERFGAIDALLVLSAPSLALALIALDRGWTL